MRFLIGLLVMLLAAVASFGAAYFMAGRAAPPSITINQPGIIGQRGSLAFTVDTPRGTLNQLTVEVQQKGRAIQLFGLDPTTADMLKSDGPDRVRLTRPIGKESVRE